MKTILLALLLTSCATSTAGYQNAEAIRAYCAESGGIVRMEYAKYISEWQVDKIECWYGENLKLMENIESLRRGN